jgi:hypothetical protein
MKAMKILIITLLLLIINNGTWLNAQTEAETLYFKSFVRLGLGKNDDNINLGGGLFFPFSKKFMLGIRSNLNTELKIFKIPSENLFDIELTTRFVPVIWKNIVVLTGGGIGVAAGKQRGALLNTRLFVEEYEEIKFNSVSFLAEIEIGYFITKFIGISISGYSLITDKKNITTYQIGLFFYGLNNP